MMMANLLSTNVVVSIYLYQRIDNNIERMHLQYIIIVYSIYAYKLHATNTKPKMVPYLTIAHIQLMPDCTWKA